ncbi:MAG: hypothetical protein Q7T04_02140 [Dehalococcoidia bacterium]|nr:hypothetical protein [Dehalococcoidia bacterium]
MARILSTDAERLLGNVHGQNVFWCHDSCIMKNLRELRDALANMSAEVFAFHVNGEKNDFANWVRDVVNDETLARQIERSRNRARTAQIVAERVNFLSTKLC